MAKYIKNTDSIARTWCGMEVQPGAYYLLQATEESKWANSSTVLQSIVDETLIVSSANGTPGHITDYASAVNFLKGDLLDVDDQGRQILRVAAACAGWSYLASSIEFKTSKIGSVFSQDHLGNNQTDITAKFYNANNVEVTNEIDEATIVRTEVLFKPSHDYELVSGQIHQVSQCAGNLRLWVVGGIIELGGPYIKEFARGLNMKFFGPDEIVVTDGRASKYMKKDIVGVPYQANQVKLILKHDAGLQHDLMLVFEYYRA